LKHLITNFILTQDRRHHFCNKPSCYRYNKIEL